jgi:hypothetical protein
MVDSNNQCYNKKDNSSVTTHVNRNLKNQRSLTVKLATVCPKGSKQLVFVPSVSSPGRPRRRNENGFTTATNQPVSQGKEGGGWDKDDPDAFEAF